MFKTHPKFFAVRRTTMPVGVGGNSAGGQLRGLGGRVLSGQQGKGGFWVIIRVEYYKGKRVMPYE